MTGSYSRTRVVCLDEVDSTNSEAMRRAMGGACEPLWIMAERQTSGRGRSGRVWDGGSGNLTASLLLPLKGGLANAARLSLVAGVAVVESVKALNGGATVPGVFLKWPNDVLIGGAKLGGVLIESSQAEGRSYAIIGVGLNLATAPHIYGRRATTLREAIKRDVSPEAALAALDIAFSRWAIGEKWQGETGFHEVRSAWCAASLPTGTEMSVHTQSGLVQGRFSGLDENGWLLLTIQDGSMGKFNFGEVCLASETEMS